MDKPTHQVREGTWLAIVAEAPAERGWWETGQAFYSYDSESGGLKLMDAGRNLNCCLSRLKTTVEQSYFVEAIKCRPDNISKRSLFNCVRLLCLPFLEQQLKAIRPELVLALGKLATASCLEIAGGKTTYKFKLGDVVGRPIEWEAPWGNCWIVPLYHTSPANNGRWPDNCKFIHEFLIKHPEFESVL